MTEEDYQGRIRAFIADAVDYVDTHLAPDREKAQKYYKGELPAPVEVVRSQVVMTEVRDVILGMMPDLLRIVSSSEKPCEYMPTTAAKVAMAAQATDYIAHVFYNDNPGFLILHDWLKDGLKSKIGIVKWRWASDQTVTETSFTGLEDAQVQMLVVEPGVEVLEQKTTVTQEAVVDPASGMQISPAVTSHDIRIRRTVPRDRAIIECLPPEEFIVARDARCLEDGSGHRTYKTLSELVAMGYDEDEIREHAGAPQTFDQSTEAQTRNPAIMSILQTGAGEDKYEYVECYLKIDKDGDGVAELRKVCTIGNAYILHDEVTDDVPMAIWSPDPEPHMVVGGSMAEQVQDLQDIKSNVSRGMLDSLAMSIFPRTAVVEGQVNLDDVMNNSIGAIIRQRVVGAVQPLTTPFIGQQAMPIINWLDGVRAQRTGMSPASQGLDPEVLQSTTKAAVTATVTGAQARTELVARIFAETGLKSLFRGLLKLIVRHQDKPRTIRLRDQWVTVDPRYWDADLDVKSNVALGRGTDQDRMMFLMQVLQKQELIIAQMGMMNPVCGVPEYWNTLDQLCSLAGFKDTTRYFKQPTPETMQQMAQMAQQQKPQDPNQQLVQIEAGKAQAKIQGDQIKLQQDAAAAQAEDARQREKMANDQRIAMEKIRADLMLGIAKIEAETQSKVDLANLDARVSLATAEINAATQRHAAEQASKNQPET